MPEVKVWLSGEGPSEVGDRDKPNGQRRGALEALLLRIESEGWSVDHAIRWKNIRKYRAGGAKHADTQNVKGLALEASENGADAVVFSRDIDADDERAAAIKTGIEEAERICPELEIIGGPAKPALEGWILALLGQRDTDSLSRKRANELLAKQEIAGKRAEDYVEVIENADLEHLPPGCESLKSWLERARAGLSKAIRG
jgi:hypothetical protein